MLKDQSINFGQHNALVWEVIDFVSSGRLLKPSSDIAGKRCDLQDLELAKEYAWEKYYGEEEDMLWDDLRSVKSSDIWGIIFSDSQYKKLYESLTSISLLKELSILIARQLDARHDELQDDICTHIQDCIYARVLFGCENPFFEKLFEIYQSGGWPCGWQGNWPEGQPIVYYPSENI